MLKKIYVGNLPFDTTEKKVREIFAPYGDVFAVDMVIENETSQFRGFCFVEMEEEAADAAIAGLKGHKIEGRTIKISAARSDKAAPGNHAGSNMHLRTSRGQFGGRDEFGHNGRSRGPSSSRGRSRGGGGGSTDTTGNVRGNNGGGRSASGGGRGSKGGNKKRSRAGNQ